MSAKSKKNTEEVAVDQEKQEQTEKLVVGQEQQEQLKQQPEALIYVGPSLPNGMLTKYTIFSNGIPDHLKSHFEKCPAFKRLFIPASQLTAAESRLKDTTSAESVFYRQTIEYFTRKG
ncbi:hypothetical protein [Thermaerobacillus caldiproteolyticus]|uniref:hypothetical protein n=1 Tax=Thermaerobacillus caldiproteolyticus TaxID=247480 RepID=UPI00188A25F5|nr:hypothetical protein [Anoxybacillus caldiproteolyticus]QPA33431.1 hypothetical protein ISX45_19110 [Anoxybacillus caldiproteolyticus]